MADQWYYTHGDDKVGPFSGRQLKELADAGKILPTDTVWKEGVEMGVLARKVKNLFPAAGPSEPPAAQPAPAAETTPAAPDEPVPQSLADEPESRSEEPVTAAKKPNPQQNQPRGHAIALKGAIIVSQDGFRVHFRKKCTTCGHEDAARSSLPIRNTTTQISYFCPKCKRVRPVLIQGMKK
jgi:hypothetical protein